MEKKTAKKVKQEKKEKRKSPGQKELSDLKVKYKKEPEKKTTKKKKKVIVPKSSKELKQEHILFCEEYIKTNDATTSYMKMRPKVKASTARTESCKLLKNPNIKAYIEERLKPQQEEEIKKTIADTNEVLEFITSVMRGEVKDQLGFDTSVKDRLTAGKMLADRYRLFDKPDNPENDENNDMPEMKITIIDNSELEEELYKANDNK